MNAVKSVFNKLTILSIRGRRLSIHPHPVIHLQMNSDYSLVLDDLPCLYSQPYPPWSYFI